MIGANKKSRENRDFFVNIMLAINNFIGLKSILEL